MARKSRLGAVRLKDREKKIRRLFDKGASKELRTGFNPAARSFTTTVKIRVSRSKTDWRTGGDSTGYYAVACFKGAGASAARTSRAYFPKTDWRGKRGDRDAGGGHVCGYTGKVAKTPTAAVKAALADLSKKTK